MARMPTTATCWVIKDRFSAVRKRSVRMVKKIEASSSAMSGPIDEIRRARARAAPGSPPSSVARSRANRAGPLLRSGPAGVGVAGYTRPILGEVDPGVNAETRHLQWVLLRGGRDASVLDPTDARATAVHRDDQHPILLAPVLQRLVDAEGRRLIDRIDDIDAGVLGEAVLHLS